MGNMDKIKISIETLIDAGREKAWQYWTLPEHITRWNFAADDWHCPRAMNDLRVGGKMNFRMEAKDGSFGFDFEAVYDEVTEHCLIAYTMTDGRQATTRFDERVGKTFVSIVFDAEHENPVDLQRAGWQAILDNYKKYTEAD